jgi:hypothetical protein
MITAHSHRVRAGGVLLARDLPAYEAREPEKSPSGTQGSIAIGLLGPTVAHRDNGFLRGGTRGHRAQP